MYRTKTCGELRLADNGVDGEDGGDQIVGENDAVDDPGGDGSGFAVTVMV